MFLQLRLRILRLLCFSPVHTVLPGLVCPPRYLIPVSPPLPAHRLSPRAERPKRGSGGFNLRKRRKESRLGHTSHENQGFKNRVSGLAARKKKKKKKRIPECTVVLLGSSSDFGPGPQRDWQRRWGARLLTITPLESGRVGGTEKCPERNSTPGRAPLFPDLRPRRQRRQSLSDPPRRMA